MSGRGRPKLWTPEHEATIRKMREEGQSVLQIAQVFGKTEKGMAAAMSRMGIPRLVRWKREPHAPKVPERFIRLEGFWTQQRLDFLTASWAEGKSARAIAQEIGGISRNAVLGKVFRMGLSEKKGTAPRRNVVRTSVLAPRVKREPKPKAIVMSAKPSRLVADAFPQLLNTAKPSAPRPYVPKVVKGVAGPGAGTVRFLDRVAGQCAWPKWSMTTPLADKMCCGHPVETGHNQPYCAFHQRLNVGAPTNSERTAIRDALRAEAA